MNLELRKDILGNSLELEDALNRILIGLIKIKKEEPKTLGHQSSTIPFSSKVNLLYDLGAIEKEEYNLLFCFMEIRNQFMHNLDAETHEKVIRRISKKKLFFSIDNEIKKAIDIENDVTKKENLYKQLYRKFYSKLLQLIIKQYENVIERNKEEKINQVKIESLEGYQKMLKIFSDSVEEVLQEVIKGEKEIYNVDDGIGKTIKSLLNKVLSKKFKEEFPEIYDDDKSNKEI